MNTNMNRVKRNALKDGLKFYAPGSDEYNNTIAQIEALDRKYHNCRTTCRTMSKEHMLAILSAPVTKR